MQWAALAAVVAALAVGIWAGPQCACRQLPMAAMRRSPQSPGGSESAIAERRRPLSAARRLRAVLQRRERPQPPQSIRTSLTAAVLSDPRYNMQRAALIRGLEAQLKTLPPDTQHKVASSLATIRTSIQELQDALGKDPANALLQELLVNSYQDEMRVLSAVHEAGGVNGGFDHVDTPIFILSLLLVGGIGGPRRPATSSRRSKRTHAVPCGSPMSRAR